MFKQLHDFSRISSKSFEIDDLLSYGYGSVI